MAGDAILDCASYVVLASGVHLICGYTPVEADSDRKAIVDLALATGQVPAILTVDFNIDSNDDPQVYRLRAAGWLDVPALFGENGPSTHRAGCLGKRPDLIMANALAIPLVRDCWRDTKTPLPNHFGYYLTLQAPPCCFAMTATSDYMPALETLAKKNNFLKQDPPPDWHYYRELLEQGDLDKAYAFWCRSAEHCVQDAAEQHGLSFKEGDRDKGTTPTLKRKKLWHEHKPGHDAHIIKALGRLRRLLALLTVLMVAVLPFSVPALSRKRPPRDTLQPAATGSSAARLAPEGGPVDPDPDEDLDDASSDVDFMDTNETTDGNLLSRLITRCNGVLSRRFFNSIDQVGDFHTTRQQVHDAIGDLERAMLTKRREAKQRSPRLLATGSLQMGQGRLGAPDLHRQTERHAYP